MWRLADRIASTVSDFTIGTVIVLAHATLASRESLRRHAADPRSLSDGARAMQAENATYGRNRPSDRVG